MQSLKNSGFPLARATIFLGFITVLSYKGRSRLGLYVRKIIMKSKILKNIFLSFLCAMPIGVYADNYLTGPTLRTGVYISAGYTLAGVQNADSRGFTMYSVNPTDGIVYASYSDKYGNTRGGYFKIGNMDSKNWGYEFNTSYTKGSHTATYEGYINVPGLGVVGTGLFTRDTFVSATEMLGVYATSLAKNLNLYAKFGLGYEHEKSLYYVNGYTLDSGYYAFSPTETKEVSNSFGPAGALELRYYLNNNFALTLEGNDLAAKENIIAANFGVTYAF